MDIFYKGKLSPNMIKVEVLQKIGLPNTKNLALYNLCKLPQAHPTLDINGRA